MDGQEGGYADHDGEKTTHELSVGQIGHDQPKAYPYSSSSGDNEKTTLMNDPRGLAALNGEEGGYAESDGEKTTHTLEASEREDQVATEDETHEEGRCALKGGEWSGSVVYFVCVCISASQSLSTVRPLMNWKLLVTMLWKLTAISTKRVSDTASGCSERLMCLCLCLIPETLDQVEADSDATVETDDNTYQEGKRGAGWTRGPIVHSRCV